MAGVCFCASRMTSGMIAARYHKEKKDNKDREEGQRRRIKKKD